MEFDAKIAEFKGNTSEISSPLWIWYTKKDKYDVTCEICKTTIHRKDFTTGGMTQHLKHHHNFISKYNAWKIFEELSLVKEDRLKNRKRKNEQCDESRPKKQRKVHQC